MTDLRQGPGTPDPPQTEASRATQFKPGNLALRNTGKGGPQWRTIIKKFMEAPAREDYAKLAREVGIVRDSEPCTLRMAMIATAIKRYQQGGPDSAPGDPKILKMLMDREDGAPEQTVVGDDEKPVVVHHIRGFS